AASRPNKEVRVRRCPLLPTLIAASLFALVPAARAVDDAAPKPFDDVVRGAQRIDGLFPLWTREGKVWLELTPAQLERTYLCSPTLEGGLGEGGFWSAPPLDAFPFVFRRSGANVLLVKKNLHYRSRVEGAPAQAVARGFADSILASAPVA